MTGAVVAACLAVSASAHADLVTRAMAAADGGGGGALPTQADDLVAWAGEPHAITLPELLQLAVREAPALASARIDIAVADAQIAETWARRDWHFTAQAAASKSIQYFSGVAIRGQQYGVTADLARVLPTGGTIDLHVASQYNDSSSTFGTSTYWLDTVSGSITQPLLKGRGEQLYDAPERKAVLVRDVAVLARRLVALQTVQTVVSGYWDLVLAERQVAITEQSLALARERLRVTEIGHAGGKIAEAEIPAVQQIIATREEDVLNGELNVLIASIALRRAVGLPIGAGELGLRVATDLETRDQPWSLGPLVERAFAASPELAELEKQNANQTIDIEVTENGLLPQLDAALTLGPTGQDPSFPTAAKNLVELNSLAIAGTLTYSRSLEQRDVLGRARELRATRDKLRVTGFDLRAQIAQAMASSVAKIELAKRRVVLSERAIELANRNIKIETDRFNLGTRTNFDVLNRLEDLRQAELRKAQAMIDWHKAETVVQTLTGDLLPAFGIAVD